MSRSTSRLLALLTIFASCMLQLAAAEMETADFSLGVLVPVIGVFICIIAVVVVLHSGRGESQQAGNPPSNPQSNPPVSSNANSATTGSSAGNPEKGSTDTVAESNAKSKQSYKTAREYKEEMRKRQTQDD